MKFTLYRSNCLEVPENCTYPHKVEVTGKDSLIEAVKHDYVCAEYQGNYRSNDNFIGSDCLPVDCDNDRRSGRMGLSFRRRYGFPRCFLCGSLQP